MSDYLPWFLLFMTFLILESHKIEVYDFRNKILFEPAVTDSLTTDARSCTNNSACAENTHAEKTSTLSAEISNVPFNEVPAKAENNFGEKSKSRTFNRSMLPRRHYKRISKYRLKISNSKRDEKSKANLKKQTKSVNRIRTTNSSFLSVLEELDDIHDARNDEIHPPKAMWNILSFAKRLSTEINKDYKNRVDAEVSKILQHVRDGRITKYDGKGNRNNSEYVKYIRFDSKTLEGRYAYFTNDGNVVTPENPLHSFVGCFSTHEYCGQAKASRRNQRRRSCTCDEDCETFGNCCVDYNFRHVNVETMRKVRYSCVKTRRYFGYFAVSSCPSFWRNSHARSLCENAKNDESDIFLQVPVSSKDTNLTYGNVYCAFCNGDTNAEFWSVQTKCPNSSQHSADSKGLTDCSKIFSAPSFLLGNEAEQSSHNLPKCLYDLVSKCPQNWMSQTSNETAMEVAIKCSLIHAPVSLFGIWSSETPKYKNEYCAICNGVTAIHLFCPVKFPRAPANETPGISMSVLLDMDFTTGGMIVGSQERCPHMHLYDPWKGVCRSVACKPNSDYKSGHCVAQKSYSDNSMEHKQENQQLSNESSFSDCLQMILALEEVIILENGTLVIKSDGSVYHPGEYDSINNSTVTVCIPQGGYSYIQIHTGFQGHLTIIGMSISIISLLIRAFLSVIFPERHKLPPNIVVFLSITLFFSQTLFVFGIYQTGNRAVCVVIGVFMHYGFLSTFFWTNVLAYDMWKTFTSSQIMTKARRAKKQLLFYCIYGWISPLFVVALAVSFEWLAPFEFLKPLYGKSVCWISNKAALAAFFGLPLAFLLASNTIFFFTTSMEIRKTTKATKLAHDSCSGAKNRARFALYCKLGFIMGLTWVFGFVAAFSRNSVLWYFFVAFNSIQGVYIFVAFTHFRIPSKFIPKKSSQWTLSGNSTTSRTSATVTASITKI